MAKSFRFAIGEYQLQQVLQKNAQLLGQRCGTRITSLLVRQLTEVIGLPEDDRYSYISRKAIEEHEQNLRAHEARDVLLEGLRDVALAYIDASPSDAGVFVGSLLSSEYQTLVRLGIYLCGEKYELVGKWFWKSFKPNWFVEAGYWHEIYWFLEKSFAKFSEGEKKRYFDVLQSASKTEPDAGSLQIDARIQRDLLHPILGQGFPEVEAQYAKLVELVGKPGEQPDFRSYSSMDWVGERSPITADALLKKSDEDLLEYLRSFRPTGEWHSATVDGLGEALSEAIRVDFPRFTKLLAEFSSLPRTYQHALLRAFEKLWNDAKEIPWQELLAFQHALVSDERFEEELIKPADNDGRVNAHWISHDIADLVEAGVKNDSHAFEPGLIKEAEQLLVKLLELVPSEASTEFNGDAVTRAINTTRGQVIEALINLWLRRCRLADAESQSHVIVWKDIQKYFDNEIARSLAGHNLEFSTLVGLYLPNIHYLSPEWVNENFKNIFPVASPEVWKCAAEGFSYVVHYHLWLYEQLRDHGDLRRMAFDEGLTSNVKEKALQYLVIAYLDGVEELSDQKSLLGEIVNELHVPELKHICWFIWTMRGAKNDSERNSRVITFWTSVSQRISGNESEHAELLSSLNFLAEFITELTEPIQKVWMQAAPFANIAYNGHVLVENMARLADAFPAEVLKVFKAALSGFIPDYDPKEVVACISTLFERLEFAHVAEICDMYAAKGSQLLREKYDEFRRIQ